MIELFQTEWCPYSRRVRHRLTELGVDFVARQVPADRQQRTRLDEATGDRGIPALLLDDGTAITGTDEIMDHLAATYPETPGTAAHRASAAAERERRAEKA